jgi:hypothetical protein
MTPSPLQRLLGRSAHSSATPRTRRHIAAATLALALGGTSAVAAIVAVVPSVVLFVPTDVRVNQTQSNVRIIAFDEQQCIVLTADLHTDQATIPRGTRVSCHFLHSDPVTTLLLNGQAQFNSNIIGVISSSAGLDASDRTCGRPGVIYPAPGTEPNRGLESFQPTDLYAITSPNVIQLQTDVPSFSDQVRVITGCADTGGAP